MDIRASLRNLPRVTHRRASLKETGSQLGTLA